jgi:hypothetical protein
LIFPGGWEKFPGTGKKSQETWGEPTGEKFSAVRPRHFFVQGPIDYTFKLYVQSAGEGRRNLKPALFGKVNGCIDIALFTAELHALNVLEHFAIFKALIFRGVLFWTVFARR